MADNSLDLKKIKELIEVMKANGLEELEIKQGDNKVFLKRNLPQVIQHPAHSTPSSVQESRAEAAPTQTADASVQPGVPQKEKTVEIKSPLVGTFYAKPSPDAEPYVEIGSQVNSRTVVCIIEAMKVMNEIKAETDGTIVEVLVTNGQAVEYGQALFKVRPD